MQVPIYYNLIDFIKNLDDDYFNLYDPREKSYFQYIKDIKDIYDLHYSELKRKYDVNFGNLQNLDKNFTVDKLQIKIVSDENELKIIQGSIEMYPDLIERHQTICVELQPKIKELSLIIDKINSEIEIQKDRFKNNLFAVGSQNTKLQTFEIPEIEPYSKEIGKGKNIPYKLALLRELGLLDILNKKYSNNSEQLYRVLNYLTGGNSKNYYLSMYGTDYNGKDEVTRSHTAHLRENDLI